MTTKTPEQMAEEYCEDHDECEFARDSFLAGYQAAKNSPEKPDTCEHILDMGKMVDVNSSNNSNGWIPVSDRLPEYDQLVLIWHPGFKQPFVGSRVDSALMSPLYWWRCELDMYEPEEIITHWMPLPAPPEPTE